MSAVVGSGVKAARAVANAPRNAVFSRRRIVNKVALTLSLAAMAFGLFWLIWILVHDGVARHCQASPRTRSPR